MRIDVINTCEEVRRYIQRVKDGESPEICWEEEVISGCWDRLCCYAPFDLSERKPKAIRDVFSLEKQCGLLERIDVHALQREFERAASSLPNGDDDPIAVAIFPGDPDNAIVNERQNGVVGTSLFGNMYIQANPCVEGCVDWIKYVFAHEYHHAVWGNYWYVMHGGELENKLIDALVIEGEADCFAMSLYPALRPQWLFGMAAEEIGAIWERKYRTVAERADVDHAAYLFGSEAIGIPWCAGYAVGCWLVREYLNAIGKSIPDILEVKPEQLLRQLTEMGRLG
ncbi:MAG: DUF2268 domain-containing putative Zn-dependent protease [Candidatus Faecivicinus sp.]